MKLKRLLTIAGVITLGALNMVLAQEGDLNKLKTQDEPADTLLSTVAGLNSDIKVMKRLKISGYIQPQWQHIDSAGAPSYAGGDFSKDASSPYNNRFTMRRGRFKFTYDYENVRFLMNIDVTERGVFMRETYVKVTDPWLKMFSLTAGCMQDPFGFEVTYSSSERETPERARYNQILFPTERDLGIIANVTFPNSSPLYGIKIDAAIMNGSAGVNTEFDSNKDFVGRIQYSRTTKSENISYAIGGSYYDGGYRIGTVKDYELTTLSSGDQGYTYAADTANYNRKATRNYIGADAQFSFSSRAGITTIRAEYITGEQPGTSSASKSPSAMPTSSLYHRNFDGAYFYFIQGLGHSKFQVVLKYDWYDENTKIKGTEIGKPGTNTNLGDIRFDTYGFGINYYMNKSVKLMAYYDLVKNESTSISGYTQDIKDNVVTIRLQAKF